MEVLQKFRASFEINEDQETTELDAYKDRIMVFQQYLKKAIGIMEMQRKQMKTMEAVRDRQDKNTNDLLTQMMKFEETGLEYYGDQDKEKRVLTHPS
jgi:DNA-binding ferritin-like protein|tara:strand:- start:81 stop:371 length:291 start_codon:yes stop_codon:yes gene_type:complete